MTTIRKFIPSRKFQLLRWLLPLVMLIAFLGTIKSRLDQTNWLVNIQGRYSSNVPSDIAIAPRNLNSKSIHVMAEANTYWDISEGNALVLQSTKAKPDKEEKDGRPENPISIPKVSSGKLKPNRDRGKLIKETIPLHLRALVATYVSGEIVSNSVKVHATISSKQTSAGKGDLERQPVSLFVTKGVTVLNSNPKSKLILTHRSYTKRTEQNASALNYQVGNRPQMKINQNQNSRQLNITTKNYKEKAINAYTSIDVTKNQSRTAYELFGDPRFVINNKICDENTSVLIYVHSAITYFDKRLQMRKTWCNTSTLQKYGVKLAFFLGRGTAKEDQMAAEESEKFHDIIQTDFKDSYANLTYKVVSALNWMNSSCRSVKWIIKADDDMFVDIFGVLNHFLPRYESQERTMMGYCKNQWYNLQIHRKEDKKCNHKWCISSTYYPGEKYYPPHCIGPTVFITGDLVGHLLRESRKVQFFWIDDIYLTGLLMKGVDGAKILQLKSPCDVYPLNCPRKGIWVKGAQHLTCRTRNIKDYEILWQMANEQYTASQLQMHQLNANVSHPVTKWIGCK